MRRSLQVDGTVESGYDELRSVFVDNFVHRGDVGASCALYVDGRLVVDLWGGTANTETDQPWDADTVALIYSATKGAVAICLNLLVQRRVLSLDTAVADYWPEFGAAGKQHVTVAQLLSHRAGLPALAEPVSLTELLDGEHLASTLAQQDPIWVPGSAHGYHALTFGWLLGELVRRVTGLSLGRFFADEVATPLGLDFWIGLPGDQSTKVASLIDGVPDMEALNSVGEDVKNLVLQRVAAMCDPSSLMARTLSSHGALPTPNAAAWNSPAVHAAEIPAANGITNARSLARMYAATIDSVDGLRLLDDEVLTRARNTYSSGADVVLLTQNKFGLGFQLPTTQSPLLGSGSFGHAGAGGALGFADVDTGIAFGYVQNQLTGSLIGDPRTAALIASARKSVAHAGG
jgi:CubicO group peptidase (beta-lactamase class C family)